MQWSPEAVQDSALPWPASRTHCGQKRVTHLQPGQRSNGLAPTLPTCTSLPHNVTQVLTPPGFTN